jgi:hypothetical protein
LVGGVSNGSTSITIGLDFAQHDAIYLKDRSYTTPVNVTYNYSGVIDIYDVASGSDDFYQLAPGVNAPPGGATYTISQLVSKGVYVPKTYNQVLDGFNASNNITLIGYLKRYSALANMEHRIFGDRLVAFSSVIVAHTSTWSEQDGQPNFPYVQDAYVDNDLYWGFTPAPPGTSIVPVTAPSNPFSQAFVDQGADGQSGEIITAHSRFTQYPKPFQNDSDLFRVVGGLRGEIGENIHWEMAANLDRYALAYTNTNLINASAFNAGIADGTINPFAITQAPGALDGVLGTAFVNMVNPTTPRSTGPSSTCPPARLGSRSVAATFARDFPRCPTRAAWRTPSASHRAGNTRTPLSLLAAKGSSPRLLPNWKSP